MPLFFLAGGAAGAYGWRDGTPWGTWLVARAQRLCRPVFWYLAFWAVGLAVASMILGADSAVGLGKECVALLWFLGVYLVTLAFVPALTRMNTWRTVAVIVAALLVLAALVDTIRIADRRAPVGASQLLDRLADSRRDRCRLRTQADRRSGGIVRRGVRVRRAGRCLRSLDRTKSPSS